ncbi:thermonuclease family protein [Chryseosolibacter indicus]|uniref:Thermonuclease family protein n=1 Tax=Chryseosolibacter indicus TaxID=2782351 RepID=A0ABS5VL91_9BACT|nr:thermonuclease family protein [Chryseosolibacter indicus]MBT1702222.1 thermonuclease family protein [Chryseosolibacter indicus]
MITIFKNKLHRAAQLILLFFLLVQFAEPEITGSVTAIADGDTFTLLTPANKQIRVRLYGVDAPEKGQDFHNVSKQYLSDLIFKKKVVVKQINKDRYKRVVGIVTVEGINVNEALLKKGLVWHYTQYDNNKEWAKLELKARKEKKAIWSMPNPTPPWNYRKKKRTTRSTSYINSPLFLCTPEAVLTL